MGSAKNHECDVAVIGGGSAGYAAARTAVSHGLKTIVLEGAEQVAGLCILRGCMPTKALLQAADTLHMARNSSVWGLEPGAVSFDFLKVMRRKDELIADFASYRREQLQSGPFDFLRVSGRFIDPHCLELSDGGRLNARYFIICTGSRIADSPILSLRTVNCLNSDSALALEALPRSIVVLGGGPVAIEFAQFFRRFDVEVTIIQRSSHVLKEFDADAATVLEEVFRKEGITVHTNSQIVDARDEGSRKVVRFEKSGNVHECEAEEIFFGLGRTPDTAGLGLANAGVETNGARIVTSPTQQTSTPHIYAAGDCCGPYEIVHLAVQQGEIAAHNIAQPSQPRRMDYRLLTEVVFTDPQVACVGLTEKQAAARGIPCLAASYPFGDHGKSMIMNATDGFVKLLADPTSGEILGGACVGPMGGELIHEIIVAMHHRTTVQTLAAVPHYHPTLAEIWTYPAEELAERIGG